MQLDLILLSKHFRKKNRVKKKNLYALAIWYSKHSRLYTMVTSTPLPLAPTDAKTPYPSSRPIISSCTCKYAHFQQPSPALVPSDMPYECLIGSTIPAQLELPLKVRTIRPSPFVHNLPQFLKPHVSL